jgi:beta-lactamase regulating signal transducer with metallopeptidase domain
MTLLLGHLAIERLGWVLLHSLWQFALIAFLVRALERTLAGPNRAAARYGVGVCGLAALTAAPIITWCYLSTMMLPGAHPAEAGGALQLSAIPLPNPAERPELAGANRGSVVPVTESPRTDTKRLFESASAGWNLLVVSLRPWMPTLVTVWLLGMVGFSVRPLVGWATLRRLAMVGITTASPTLEESVRRIEIRFGLSKKVAVLLSTLTSTPLVVGYLHPALLLPAGVFHQLPLAELEAILAHELAHIRRHDFLVNLWQTLLETVFFYHPSVWSLSSRLRVEREHCCDDLAVTVMDDPVCYGRALLHLEELRGPEPLLALGAAGSSLPGRIRRLLNRSTPARCAPGMAGAAMLPSAALTIVLATMAWAVSVGDEKQFAPTPPQKSVAEQTAMQRPEQVARSLDIVIAQHVILWDGRVRTWDQVVTELKEIRQAQGTPIHPNFLFTNGAHAAGKWDKYKPKVMALYQELFQPAGVSFGSISPRAGPRYDVIRGADDLVANPKSLRSGIVLENGQPKAGVLVLLAPEQGSMPAMLKPDLTLRDPHDEVWTTTGPDGRFTLQVQPPQAPDAPKPPPTYALVAISNTAYGQTGIPAEGRTTTIDLLPLARVELTPRQGEPQRIDLSFRGGLLDTSPGFSIYEIPLGKKMFSIDLPPGKITVLRAFQHENGGSVGYPAESFQTGPGFSQAVYLPNITEQEAKRKWMEDSIRRTKDTKSPRGGDK